MIEFWRVLPISVVAVMPNCCLSELQVEKLIVGELDTRTRESVESHLAQCSTCRHVLRERETNERWFNDIRHAFQDHASRSVDEDESIRRALSSIGEYTIQSKLGRGGQGLVYRARHRRLKRDVAIKVLRPDCARRHEAMARFAREMEAVGQLDHFNIVRAYDAREEQGVLFLAMEYVPGGDVSSLIRRRGRLAVADACDIVRQAAIGLHHAHQHGLVHRDVKPKNLLLSPRGIVKVLDLGLARFNSVEGEDRWNESGSPNNHESVETQGFPRARPDVLTTSGTIAGTPDYMAPEQWQGVDAADARTDIYGLGCTLFHLLSGRPPFSGSSYRTTAGKMRGHVGEKIPLVSDHRDDIPRKLTTIIAGMLAKRPEDRIESAAAVADRLAPLARGADLRRLFDGPGESAATIANLEPLRAWRLFLACTFAGILIAAVATVAFFNRGEPNGSANDLAPRSTEAGGLPSLVRTARFATTATSHLISEASFVLSGHDDVIRGVQFFPDGERAVSIGWDGVVRIWKVETGEQLQALKGHRSTTLAALDVSPDGRLLASGDSAWDVIVWDAQTGRRQLAFKARGGDASVRDLDFSPDGRSLLVGKIDGVVRLFDIGSGEVTSSFEHSAVYHVATVPGGETVTAVVPGRYLTVWNPRTGHCLRTSTARLPYTYDLAVLPDGQRAVTCGADGHVTLWDLASLEPIRQFVGHEKIVHSVDISRSGRCLVSGSQDKTARVWDVEAGIELCRFTTESCATNHVAISPKGDYVLSGGGYQVESKLHRDGEYRLRLWRIPEELADGYYSQQSSSPDPRSQR